MKLIKLRSCLDFSGHYNTFKQQYISDTKILSSFEQLDRDKIVIIIDDFEEFKLTDLNKSLFVTNLSFLYSNILIFANESFQYKVTTEGQIANSLKEFGQYKINEFGHRLRDKLIKRWILLGRENLLENGEVFNITREKAKIINTTIGYNIVPSYPIYLLTLLQAMESNQTEHLSKCSYGHYYYYLIVQSLNSNFRMEPGHLTLLFTYLSTLAYYCFENQNNLLSEQELKEFDSKYVRDKRFSPPFNIISKLIDSKILVNYENNYKFTHNYIYYYFIAKYFSDNFEKIEIKEKIEKMTERLYHVEFANIIMFLIHHAPYDSILNSLIYESKKVFHDIEEFKFDVNELKNINASIEKETLKLDDRTMEESREIELSKEEQEFEKNKDLNTQHQICTKDYNEDIRELDLFSKLNLALKLINILGEIVRNYSGSLDGDLIYDLTKEVYSNGLRTLKSMLKMFEENHSLLIELIGERINKKHCNTDAEKVQMAKKMVFNLSSALSTGLVQRIAKSVGTKDLEVLHNDILLEDKNNIAFKLINSAVKLDSPNGLNISSLEKLYEELKHNNNYLAISTLRKIVLEHLYMYEVRHDMKQKVCEKIDIDNNNSKNIILKRAQQ